MRWSSDRTLIAAATVVATVATAGSLYFSLGMGLYPCELCWYQRILMYPLVVVLGVAAVDDRRPHRTVLPLAVPGVALAAYHSSLQVTTTACGLTGPCSAVLFRLPVLGLTIPNLSLVGFLLVTGLVLAAWRAPDV